MSEANKIWDDDESFLGYVEIHSRTDLALFHREHAIKLIKLAGQDPASYGRIPEFVSIKVWTAQPLVDAARKRLREKP